MDRLRTATKISIIVLAVSSLFVLIGCHRNASPEIISSVTSSPTVDYTKLNCEDPTLLCNTANFSADNMSEGARVYNKSGQKIPPNRWTILNWTSVYWDTGEIFNNGQPTRLTAPSSGTYLVIAHLVWAVNRKGSRAAAIRINGDAGLRNTLYVAHDSRNAVMKDNTAVIVQTTWPMKAGDFAEIFVYQTSGEPLEIIHDHFGSPEFTLQKIN